MTLLIEMVVNPAMNRAELLQGLLASKALHRTFSPSKRLMRILRPIVEPTPGLLTVGVADLLHAARYEESRSYRAQPIFRLGRKPAKADDCDYIHDRKRENAELARRSSRRMGFFSHL